VRGEAGIGKTSVITAFTARVSEQARVLCGACDPLSTPQPLGPIADLVDKLDTEATEFLRSARDARIHRPPLS
jgi:predicted ATPase